MKMDVVVLDEDEEQIQVDQQRQQHDDGDQQHSLQPATVSDLLQLAIEYVDDALKCRNVNFIPADYELGLYRFYKNKTLSGLLFTCYVILCCLALFEKPSLPMLELPFWATVTLELICVAYFFFRFIHESLFIPKAVFWRDAKNVTLVVILALIVLDIIVATIVYESGQSQFYIRWSRPLRPFIIVNFPECRQVRQGFRNIRRTLPEILNVLFLFFANLTLFTLMAYKLFGASRGKLSKANKEPYFETFLDSFWDLFVLVTTANSPDVMLPSYAKSRGYALFFILYLIINLYIFMSVFLAVVYNQFKANLKSEVRENIRRKQLLLDEAFDLLSVRPAGSSSDLECVITRDALFSILASVKTGCTHAYMQVIALVLDPDCSGFIHRDAFRDLVELLNIRWVDIYMDKTLLEEQWPELYNSQPSKLLRSAVKHRHFRTVFDLIIVLNAIFIGFDIDGGEMYFLMLFTLEIVLKVYTFGMKAFMAKLWNAFDFAVVGMAYFVLAIQAAIGMSDNNAMLDFLMILRVTRIFKIFHSIKRFRTVLNTLSNILPSLSTYGGIFFIVYYFFSMIGMELFQGRIRDDLAPEDCGNHVLRDTDFARSGYCPNNFNNVSSSFVMLFYLMVVNQWHILTQGYVLVTGTRWTRLFFISFHIVCVIIVLNIFIAFVLEAFMLEYTLSKYKISSRLVAKIRNMGLLYTSNSPQLKPKSDAHNNGSATFVHDEDHILVDEGEKEGNVDADHEQVVFDDMYVFDDDGSNRSLDFGTRTSLRFVISRRARSVQELLEKMFENEL